MRCLPRLCCNQPPGRFPGNACPSILCCVSQSQRDTTRSKTTRELTCVIFTPAVEPCRFMKSFPFQKQQNVSRKNAEIAEMLQKSKKNDQQKTKEFSVRWYAQIQLIVLPGSCAPWICAHLQLAGQNLIHSFPWSCGIFHIFAKKGNDD